MNKRLSKRSTFAKVLLPTVATIALFTIALFWVVIPQFENIILERKREMIRELTYSAASMINNWYKMELSGKLSTNQAKAEAINQIKSLRYGEELKDYFWVTDLHPIMLTHPYRPDLNGKDLSEVYDSHNKKLFVEMVRVVNENGEGYVDYMWQWKDDSTKIVPKLSHVKKFEPWGWVIGTGIYIEDVKEEIAQLEQRIITISVLVTVLSSVFLFYTAYQNFTSERKRRFAEAELSESRESYKMLAESSGEGLIMILENQEVYFNKTIYTLLGYEDSNIRLELSEIFKSLPESKTFDFRSLRKKSDSDLTEQLETKMVKQNGQTIDSFLIISPINFMNHQGVVISVKDISRNKAIEEALDYTKEKYLALTNQLTIGVFRATADNKARFTELNPALKNIFGVKNDDELLNTSLFDFIPDPEASQSVMKNLLNDGFIKNKAIQLKQKSGTIITVSLSAVLIRDVHYNYNSIDGIIEDISEQRKTDKDKEQLILDLQTSVMTLSQRVGSLVKSIYTCSHTSSIRDAIKTMAANDSNAILVTGNNGEEIGLFTDHDLRERVIGLSMSMDEPVYKVMSSPIYTISFSSTIYDALVKYRQNNIRRLIVKHADNSIAGVLTIDEIFDASYTNFLFFIHNIENADYINKIVKYREQLLILIKSLIEYDTNIHSITNFITMISDSITKRIIELAIKEIGEPPVRFAFITMGSEGREEQTLATDQDNAIVYEDVPSDKAEEIIEYFNRLGDRICNNLAALGYKYCKGDIMAKNPKWCQAVSSWKKYFTNWVTTSNPKDILDTKIFFDFRFIYGNEIFATQLQEHVNYVTSSFSTFFVYLGESILNINIPEGMQKLKTSVDLKLALLPIVDFARLYSIKNRLNETNTYRRLEALNDKGIITSSLFSSITYYYNYLMHKRLKRQISSFDDKVDMDNILTTTNFSDVDTVLLRSYFEFIDDLKNKISLDLKGIKNL